MSANTSTGDTSKGKPSLLEFVTACRLLGCEVHWADDVGLAVFSSRTLPNCVELRTAMRLLRQQYGLPLLNVSVTSFFMTTTTVRKHLNVDL